MTTIRRAVIPLSATFILGLTGLLAGCAGSAVAGSGEPVSTGLATAGSTAAESTTAEPADSSAVTTPSSTAGTAGSGTAAPSRPADSPAPTPNPAATTSTTSASPAPSATGPTLPALTPPYDKVLGEHGDGKVAYLTFDDGPGPQTGKILDVLRAAGVRATFCQVGSRLDDYPDAERRVVAEGHTLCNHSWSHPDGLAAASAGTIDGEISRTQRAFAAHGVTSHYFRAPQGGFGQTPTLRQVCELNQVVPLGWSVDSLDWKKPGAKTIAKNVLNGVHPGAIILLHDAGGTDRNQTIAALPDIISGLRSAGYTLAPLPAGGVS